MQALCRERTVQIDKDLGWMHTITFGCTLATPEQLKLT